MKASQILGAGSYVPSRVVTNQDLEKMMDTTDEWIVKRTGIKERRWAEPNQCTSDLGLIAAERALANANVDKESIDLIIFATISPDHDFPGTGCFLQAKLGLPGVPTLDIRQQCSAFIYSLSIADQYLITGRYKKVLIIGAELHSRGLDKTTRGRDITVLFGDGAGAVVMGSCEVNDPKRDAHLMSTHLHADGSGAKDLWMAAPGSGLEEDERISQNMIKQGLIYPQMNGKKVFTLAVKKMAEVLIEGTKANSLSLEEIDLFLFHQANRRINDTVAELLKIPLEKVHNTIHKFGNTTAATIPIGMDDALQAGKLKKGMLVAASAFGSGFTWASALFRY